jgi:hypothetical protein
MNITESGNKVDEVSVQIGPQFLHLFSEQLYSSPNKAFEELISNSWDADATKVFVHLPASLQKDDATIWVWDNGLSMDLTGFQDLWAVATSRKRDGTKSSNRKQIGKFGVGKLATYLLANELTYVCKAADGVIRAVSMDYRRIDDQKDEVLHIKPLPLSVRVISDGDLESLFEGVSDREQLLSLIRTPDETDFADPHFRNEYGGPEDPPVQTHGTWTVAVMTSLKPKGKSLSHGWIRRLLRTALPLGNSISIRLNTEVLSSAKSDVDIWTEWKIGGNFVPDDIILADGYRAAVTMGTSKYPSIEVEGLGEVTGTIRLYGDRISGGKSEEIRVSNGFFVNVRGRVLKPEDPYFGLQNLSHSAWAQFRAAVRADGLDGMLAVNRESVLAGRPLDVFRALLSRAFNTARNEYKVRVSQEWPNAGDLLTDKWGTAPLEPLRRAIEENVAPGLEVPPFVRVPADGINQATLDKWERDVSQKEGEIIEGVSFVEADRSDRLSLYDLGTRTIRINRNHPFAVEHQETAEQMRALRNTAVVDLLTEAYLLNVGISVDDSIDIAHYKDRALRLIAQVSRKSAAQIAHLLTTVTDRDKSFERIIGDALEYIGFVVRRLGGSGEPEGVGQAVITPRADDAVVAYRFTYDAKSALNGVVQTGNVGVAGLVRHRRNHEAQYTLVVGPKFQKGALEQECEEHKVTPMLARDLGKLVMATAGSGPIDLESLREIFGSFDPDTTTTVVDRIIADHEAVISLPLGVLIEALEQFTSGTLPPDTLHAVQVAERCRTILKNPDFPKRQQVAALLRGLQLVLPKAIQVQNEDIILNVNPKMLRVHLSRQLEQVPQELHYGLLRGA